MSPFVSPGFGQLMMLAQNPTSDGQGDRRPSGQSTGEQLNGELNNSMTVDGGHGWDLASGVGLTATEAAAARAVAGRQPLALVKDPYAQLLVRAVGVEFLVALAEMNVEEAESGFALPRLVDWVAVRTSFFDDFISAATETGITQVVILGAGLDSRAYRLDWAPQTVVYEVDRPAVLDLKTAAMERADVRAHAVRIPTAADLAADWKRSLLAGGFDPQSPTVWCAEGVLPYLPQTAVAALLDIISSLSAVGSRLAADSVIDIEGLVAQIAASPGFNSRPSELQVDIGGIGVPSSPCVDVAGHLRRCGWEATDVDASDLFELHELAPLADSLALYQRIRLVTASAWSPRRSLNQGR